MVLNISTKECSNHFWKKWWIQHSELEWNTAKIGDIEWAWHTSGLTIEDKNLDKLNIYLPYPVENLNISLNKLQCID